jgi:hypothetical protein
MDFRFSARTSQSSKFALPQRASADDSFVHLDVVWRCRHGMATSDIKLDLVVPGPFVLDRFRPDGAYADEGAEPGETLVSR